MEPVVLYGTSWCAQTQLLRRHLERLGVPYRYVDLELHPEVHPALRFLAGGRLSHPVVYAGGQVLVEPTLPELERALWRRGYLWRPW
jgi:mycoredoxin